MKVRLGRRARRGDGCAVPAVWRAALCSLSLGTATIGTTTPALAQRPSTATPVNPAVADHAPANQAPANSTAGTATVVDSAAAGSTAANPPAASAPADLATVNPKPSNVPVADTAPGNRAAQARGVVVAPDLAAGATVNSGPAPVRLTKPEVETVAPESESDSRWYGWQNLILDGSLAFLMIGGAVLESEEAAGVGALGYLIGGPIVHWSHGNIAEGFGSLGLRVAAAGVLLVGTALCVSNALSGNSSDGGCVVAMVGVASVPAAIAIDAAVLAYDAAPESPESATRLIPWVNNERRAAGVNWVGRF